LDSRVSNGGSSDAVVIWRLCMGVTTHQGRDLSLAAYCLCVIRHSCCYVHRRGGTIRRWWGEG